MREAWTATVTSSPVPRASPAATAGVLSDVILPLFAQGVIVRRPRVVAAAEQLDANRRAVRRLQSLRGEYGTGPVRLAVPGRNAAIILSPNHVQRVLDESPEPFTPASREKRAALSHFQPEGVLISRGARRTERRLFNEAVLDSSQPMHQLAAILVTKVREEAEELLAAGRRAGALGWDEFTHGWWRMVRRVVLGDAARDDHELTNLLTKLRGDANWAFLKPKRTRLRDRFFGRLNEHLARAEPGSLASLVASVPRSADTAPGQQVPQWLFAFDAAGMASFRALALLAGHRDQADRARTEIAACDLEAPEELPFLRACVLESVRLWPTTPAVLRDTTEQTNWESGTLPAGTGIVVFAPFFHRDDERLPYANSFAPDIWLGDPPPPGSALIPFSAGPAECAGRNLVLLITSSLVANLLAREDLRQLRGPALQPDRPIPDTLNPFGLRFELAG